jgi:hypothetical protein
MHSDNRALTLAVGPFCLLKPGEDKKVIIFWNSYKIFLAPQFDRDQLSYIKYPEPMEKIDSIKIVQADGLWARRDRPPEAPTESLTAPCVLKIGHL